MKNTQSKYFNLYHMLDRFPYILANSLEQGLKEEYNELLYTALMEYNQEYYGAMTDEELKNEGWDGEQDRYDFIADCQYPEIYQTYIVTEYGYDVLKDFGELVWYNEEIDLHFWGVMHYGTAWSHVMDKQFPMDNKECYYNYDSNICKFEECKNAITGMLYCDEHRQIIN